MLISLELENAIPDIWDHGGSFKIGDTIMERKVAFEYPDGTTLWFPLCDLPDSYLKSHSNQTRDRTIVRAMGNEIFKRRKAKRDEERASVNSSI